MDLVTDNAQICTFYEIIKRMGILKPIVTLISRFLFRFGRERNPFPQDMIVNPTGDILQFTS